MDAQLYCSALKGDPMAGNTPTVASPPPSQKGPAPNRGPGLFIVRGTDLGSGLGQDREVDLGGGQRRVDRRCRLLVRLHQWQPHRADVEADLAQGVLQRD